MIACERKITDQEEGDIFQLQTLPYCPVCREKGRKKVKCRSLNADTAYCPKCKGRYPIQKSMFRQEIMNRIFVRYDSLIHILAKQALKKGFRDLNDLISRGFFGLMDAVEHWNPRNGKATFRTFASYWINKTINDPEEGATVNHQKVPDCPVCSKGKKGRVRCYKIDLTTAYCPKCGGEFPLKGTSRAMVSLDEPTNEEDDASSLYSVLSSSNPGPDQEAENSETRAGLKLALSKLPSMQRKVLECRFLQDKTLAETGRQLGNLTKERARQIEQEALAALRFLISHDPAFAALALPYFGQKEEEAQNTQDNAA